MPNLTSYHAPSIHLNRELPKTYCDLIRHEMDYSHFLHTRIANIQSSLVFTNKKHLTHINQTRQRGHIDHNERLSHVYQRNLQLCKKILQIWTNNGQQQGGVDCHNENYKKRIIKSQFHSRQKQQKNQIENENKRFIHSLISHQKKYRPTHDRSNAHDAFQKHLKLLQSMSQYPKYILTNSIHKNLLDYNYSQFYHRDQNIPEQILCQTLPHSYKTNKQKSKTIKIKPANDSVTYLPNLAQKTINNAIYICKIKTDIFKNETLIFSDNQPVFTLSKSIKSSYSANDQQTKARLHQPKLFRSSSCRQLLEPWHNKTQKRQ